MWLGLYDVGQVNLRDLVWLYSEEARESQRRELGKELGNKGKNFLQGKLVEEWGD